MKKLISLLAILILVFAMFVACNPDQINTKDDDVNIPANLDVYDQEGNLLTVDFPLEFGEVAIGKSKKLEVKIHNSGKCTLWSPSIYVYKGSENFIPEPIAVDSFPVGASMSNTIIYTPTIVEKEKAIIRIEAGYSLSPMGPIIQYTRDFLVIGAGAEYIVEPIINVYYEDELVNLENPVDFGNVYVGNEKELKLVVKNEGTVSLKSPTVAIISPTKPEWKITDFGGIKSFNPGDEIVLYMTYIPRNIGEDKVVPTISGFFYTNVGGPYNYKTQFAAIGNGLAPLLVIRDVDGNILTLTNPLDFGMVVVQQKKKLEVFITNEGNATLYSPQMNHLSPVKTPFTFDQLGIRSLPPSSTISTTIYFRPPSEEIYTTSLSVSGWYGNNFADVLNYSTSFGVKGKGVYVFIEE